MASKTSLRGDLRTNDMDPTFRNGNGSDIKRESPYYSGTHSGASAAITKAAEVNGSQNGRGVRSKILQFNGDAPQQEKAVRVKPYDAPVPSRQGSLSGGMDGDESPGSTFEIPLDQIYSLAEKGRSKPKKDRTTHSETRPERPARSNGFVDSASKTSKPSGSVSTSQKLAHSQSNGANRDRRGTNGKHPQEPIHRKTVSQSPTLMASHKNPRLSVTGVASAIYKGGWLPAEAMCSFPQDIAKFNSFLKSCRSEVEAGVPGRWLTVVMGSEAADLDSIVSTLTYAYFLGSTGSEDQQCFVPVLNMKQEDLALHTEAVWLFGCTGVDVDSFIFVDQISLSYFHRFGSLKLILVDHSRLAPHQENLQEAVVEIVDHTVPENMYAWVTTLEIEQVGSCATIIAERYAAEAPQLVAGRGVNRLLLAAILLDTNNLEPTSTRCTPRDECMAAFLLHGAGRYGRHGFFRLLRKKKCDVSGLSSKDTLRKDFKQWTLGPGKTDSHGCKGKIVAAGMSTLGMALLEFLRRDASILDEIIRFRRTRKLDLFIVITGYYDKANQYKREMLIETEDEDFKQHLATCLKAHSEELKLSPLHIEELPKDMLVFIQGNVTASRKTIRSILAEYFAI